MPVITDPNKPNPAPDYAAPDYAAMAAALQSAPEADRRRPEYWQALDAVTKLAEES